MLAILEYGLPEPTLALADADLAIPQGTTGGTRVSLPLVLALTEGALAPIHDLTVTAADGSAAGDEPLPAVTKPAEGWPTVTPEHPAELRLMVPPALADRLALTPEGAGFLRRCRSGCASSRRRGRRSRCPTACAPWPGVARIWR